MTKGKEGRIYVNYCIPVEIIVFQKANCIHRKNYLLLSGCRGHVVLGTKKKIKCKIPY